MQSSQVSLHTRIQVPAVQSDDRLIHSRCWFWLLNLFRAWDRCICTVHSLWLSERVPLVVPPLREVREMGLEIGPSQWWCQYYRFSPKLRTIHLLLRPENLFTVLPKVFDSPQNLGAWWVQTVCVLFRNLFNVFIAFMLLMMTGLFKCIFYSFICILSFLGCPLERRWSTNQ